MNRMIRIILISGFMFLSLALQAQFYDAELISKKTEIEVKNNKLTKSEYFEIKINNRAGEVYSKIGIPYSKLNRVSKLDAYIKDSKGAIVRKLKASEIVEQSYISDISFYEDNLVKVFTLKHNNYPYTIVYSYQYQFDEFLEIDRWLPVLDTDIPTHDAVLTVTLPSDYQISYLGNHIEEPVKSIAGNLVTYRWKAVYTDVIEPELFSPPLTNSLPSVRIVPNYFRFDINGSFDSWTSYGNWHYELNKGLNELPDNEKAKILDLVKGISDDKEKIKVLYHYLQDVTRYINVTIETGGLKPYPASYVAANKYGDCKALSNYFKSILEVVNIKSYYTLIFADEVVRNLYKDFPSQQFNHIILFVPLKSDTIWLDCTSDLAFNYQGTFIQNRYAFIIDENNSHFVRTPALKPSDVLETRSINVDYNPTNGSNTSFRCVYKGEKFEVLSQVEQLLSENNKSAYIRGNFIENGFEPEEFKISKRHRDSTSIEFTLKAVSHNIYRQYGNEILVSNIPFKMPAFEKPADRLLPVQIDFPVNLIDTVTYAVPAGFKSNISLPDYAIKCKYGYYTINIVEQDNKIQVIKSMLINSGNYPLSEYKDFYAFLINIDEMENKVLITLKR